MPYLKIYEWEDATYQEFVPVKLDKEHQVKLLLKLSRHFKTSMPMVGQSHGRGLNYMPLFKTINTHVISSMGNIIHEFAHHLDHEKYRGQGHRKSFKKALKRTYRYSVRFLQKETGV